MRTRIEKADLNDGQTGDDRPVSGFTLIELMIVVVVLGTLIGLVLLGVGGFQESGVTAVCRSEIDSLRTANVAYRAKHGADAASVADLLDDYLERAPKYVKFSNGATNPATADGCDGTLIAAPPVLGLTAGIGVTGISGSAAASGASDEWSTNLTVTVQDGAGAPVPDVEVVGDWTDGNARGCTTEADGTCSITTHHGAADSGATWNVVTVDGEARDNTVPSITCTKLPSFGCS